VCQFSVEILKVRVKVSEFCWITAAAAAASCGAIVEIEFGAIWP